MIQECIGNGQDLVLSSCLIQKRRERQIRLRQSLLYFFKVAMEEYEFVDPRLEKTKGKRGYTSKAWDHFFLRKVNGEMVTSTAYCKILGCRQQIDIRKGRDAMRSHLEYNQRGQISYILQLLCSLDEVSFGIFAEGVPSKFYQ